MTWILPLLTDVYESELERMNAAMTADNHALQRDNKQLNALIKEYEQTLENVMSTFRNRAVCNFNSICSTARLQNAQISSTKWRRMNWLSSVISSHAYYLFRTKTLRNDSLQVQPSPSH